MAEKLNVEGREIHVHTLNDMDYISLNDIAGRTPQGREMIKNWFRTRPTQNFLVEWESIYNSNFNSVAGHRIKDEAGDNVRFTLGIQAWIHETQAIGLYAKAGRYGGTFAHRDIAFEFGTRISARFKILLIQEFQRLRSEEFQRKNLQWDAGRELGRLNAPIMTASIQQSTQSLAEKQRPGFYAREMDMLNELVFGMTAKQWRAKNPDAKGNMRDHATTVQNILIANLENLNSYLIKNGASEEARRRVLSQTCEAQTVILNQKYLPE